MNNVQLTGYTIADSKILAETTFKLSMATTQSWLDDNGVWQKKVQYHQIVGFGYNLQRFITKGSYIEVLGALEYYEKEVSGEIRREAQIIIKEIKTLKKGRDINSFTPNNTPTPNKVKLDDIPNA